MHSTTFTKKNKYMSVQEQELRSTSMLFSTFNSDVIEIKYKKGLEFYLREFYPSKF